MRHAKLLMMVGGLLLATGPMAQGQIVFDENFEYSVGNTPVCCASDLSDQDGSWNVVTATGRFQNTIDMENTFWSSGEIGSGIMSHFQVSSAHMTKGLSGGTFNLSNLTGSQVLKATFSGYKLNNSAAGRMAFRLSGTGGTVAAEALFNSGIAAGLTAGVQLVSNTGVTDFLDLNAGVVPVVGHTPTTCFYQNAGTSTLGCSQVAIDVTMEVGKTTLGYIGRLRKFQGTGNLTTNGPTIVTQTIAHTLTDVADGGFFIDGGQLAAIADNFRIEVANSEVPEPATLGLLGLGTLLLLRRRRA